MTNDQTTASTTTTTKQQHRHLVDMGFDNIQTLMPWNRPELPHYPLTICTAYRQEKHR